MNTPSASRSKETPHNSRPSVTSVATTFPELPANLLIRENILSTLDGMFASGIQLLTIEGPDEIGKTTLLAQFAQRHPEQAITLFIKSTSLFAHDPQLVLRDICNQIFFILKGDEISDEEQTDETVYRQLLFSLLRLARRKNTDYYFLLDGIEDLPREGGARAAIFSLLPIGEFHIKCLVIAKPESIREHVIGRILQKSFTLPGFGFEETQAYFRDLGVDRKFLDDLYRISNKGVPGQMASLRRLLESGVTPEALLRDLPEKLPNLFELEWKAVNSSDERTLNLLALVSQSSHSHSIADAALILGTAPEEIRALLSPLTFVVPTKTDDAPIEFASERFRRFCAQRLSSRRARVRELAIECFLKTPDTSTGRHIVSIGTGTFPSRTHRPPNSQSLEPNQGANSPSTTGGG